jgi:hypothetical protein
MFYDVVKSTEAITTEAEAKEALAGIEEGSISQTWDAVRELIGQHGSTAERLAIIAALFGDEIAMPYAGFGPYPHSLPCEGSNKSHDIVVGLIREATFRRLSPEDRKAFGV